jgi:hypothetical protein
MVNQWFKKSWAFSITGLMLVLLFAVACGTAAPQPDASAPDTSAPDASAPDTSAPDASAPDILRAGRVRSGHLRAGADCGRRCAHRCSCCRRSPRGDGGTGGDPRHGGFDGKRL